MRLATILTLLVFVTTVCAYAQDGDSVLIDTTAFKRDFRPTGLRVGFDLINPVKSKIRDNYSAWEATADVDLFRYLVSLDYGTAAVSYDRDSTGYTTNYKSDGSYWRAGIGANFLTRDPDRNVFFIGLKYGRARYSEILNLNAYDSIWGTRIDNYNTQNRSAGWIELASGIRVKVWKFIWMGYTGSIKFGLKSKDGELKSAYVPGYGSTNKDTTFGFTYQVFFRIPFRPTTPILPPKSK
jgi:hypothetical protein